MKIIIAKDIGFCFGVKNALEAAREALKDGKKPVQFLGEVVHNVKIISDIKRKGGKIISSPKEAKLGTLVIRAHGTAPFKWPKNLEIIDATCPLVKRAQKATETLLGQGYQVVIIGDKKHPEVIGINGNINNKALVVKNEEEAEELKKFRKIGVVAQTTQNLNTVNKILKVLKKKSSDLKWLNTICPQVFFRQQELARILKIADGILIIGSTNSANTNQLISIAEKNKKSVWRINSAEELEKEMFKGVSVLGVVSGTSVPDQIVQRIVDRLKKKSYS